MNPFVATLHENLSFCPRGCGACISMLRQRIAHHRDLNVQRGAPYLEEWQIIASLTPKELIGEPHWDQLLRHLLWGRVIGPCYYPQLDRIIAQWLATSLDFAIELSHMEFLDFLVWDICHKLRTAYKINDVLYRTVVGHCTQTAALAAPELFEQSAFDSLVESLVIIRATDHISHPDLATLTALPWSRNSRTARILRGKIRPNPPA